MPERRELAAEELRRLVDDLRHLAAVLARDPKKEARKERLYGLLTIVLTMAARRAAAKAWAVLTGEQPPGKGEQTGRSARAAGNTPYSPPHDDSGARAARV